MGGSNISFQNPATPIMEGIMLLHDYIWMYLILSLATVIWMLGSILFEFFFTPRLVILQELLNRRLDMDKVRNYVHAPTLEIFWTITPSIILVLIAIPSFALLYAMDEVLEPQITFKAIGHQWYWSYEFSDHVTYSYDAEHKVVWNDFEVNFDSYMITEQELKKGEPRLLLVDNPVVLPVDTHIRVIITSRDVIHSWAVPSFGIKVDACPGRLNQAFLFIKRQGVFYGQCSELCGVYHGYMPIVVKAVSHDDYILWIKNNI